VTLIDLQTHCAGLSASAKLLVVLYHPPKPIYNLSLLIERLVADIGKLTYEFPDAIMYITGDFNSLNISQALTDTGLSQMVSDCTRGRHALDFSSPIDLTLLHAKQSSRAFLLTLSLH